MENEEQNCKDPETGKTCGQCLRTAIGNCMSLNMENHLWLKIATVLKATRGKDTKKKNQVFVKWI